MEALSDARRPLAERWAPAIGDQVTGQGLRHGVNLAALSILAAAVSVPLFYGGLFGKLVTDHRDHVQFIERGLEQGIWPAHFLFQAIVVCLAGFSHDYASLAWASLVLLTVLAIAKAGMAYGVLVQRCPAGGATVAFERRAGISHVTLLALVAAALVLASPVVRPWWTSRIYLGQISPNLWHSPTCLLCWPLAIGLFLAADAALRTASARSFAMVGLLAATSVLAKPNYFLAFAPAYTLLALWQFGYSRTWFVSQLAILPTVGILAWQFVASFSGQQAMRPGLHIAWAPLAVWRIYAHSITSSLAFSLAFPLSYVLARPRSLREDRTLCFAWCVLIVAVMWMAGFAEVGADGAVDDDFNFAWGAHLSLFILFLATAVALVREPRSTDPRSKVDRTLAPLPWWILALHVASGIVWIVRQNIGKGFG